MSVLLARLSPTEATSGATVALPLLAFFAAGAAGAGLGFLFGLPMTFFLQQAVGQQSVPRRRRRPASAIYLIKVFVADDNCDRPRTGQPGQDPALLINQLEENLVEPLGGSANAGVIGVCIILLALLAGMLLTYLWTSIRVR